MIWVINGESLSCAPTSNWCGDKVSSFFGCKSHHIKGCQGAGPAQGNAPMPSPQERTMNKVSDLTHRLGSANLICRRAALLRRFPPMAGDAGDILGYPLPSPWGALGAFLYPDRVDNIG